MSTEKMREFKAWWLDDQQAELRSSCAEGWALIIWQASRAAIEVELPVKMEFAEKGGDYFDGARNGYNQCIDACAVSLKFAGLKVKP